FDTAHPAPRLWDVAYAAYRFVPLTGSPRHGGAVPPLAAQARRARLFCDAYALADRAAFTETVASRLRPLARLIRAKPAPRAAALCRRVRRLPARPPHRLPAPRRRGAAGRRAGAPGAALLRRVRARRPRGLHRDGGGAPAASGPADQGEGRRGRRRLRGAS